MFRYVGSRCSKPDCNTLIVWKELRASEPTPVVGVLEIISGKCPKCKKAYCKIAGELVEIVTENRPLNNPPQTYPPISRTLQNFTRV